MCTTNASRCDRYCPRRADGSIVARVELAFAAVDRFRGASLHVARPRRVSRGTRGHMPPPQGAWRDAALAGGPPRAPEARAELRHRTAVAQRVPHTANALVHRGSLQPRHRPTSLNREWPCKLDGLLPMLPDCSVPCAPGLDLSLFRTAGALLSMGDRVDCSTCGKWTGQSFQRKRHNWRSVAELRPERLRDPDVPGEQCRLATALGK